MARASLRVSAETVARLTECSICLETFTDPRMLPCGHTFCLSECLTLHIQTYKRTMRKFSCPTCKQECTIPQGGIKAFPKNRYISHLLESEEEKLEPCPIIQNCANHKELKEDLYCKTCELPVCPRCCLDEHKDHEYENISTHIEAFTTRLKRVSQAAESHSAKLEQALYNLQNTEQKIQRDCDDAVKTVNEAVEDICQLARERGRELVRNIKSHQQAAFDTVQNCQHGISTRQAFTASLQERSDDLQTSGDMFALTAEIEAQIKKQTSLPLETVGWTGSIKSDFDGKHQKIVQDLLPVESIQMETHQVTLDVSDNSAIPHDTLKREMTIKLDENAEITGLATTSKYICTVTCVGLYLSIRDKKGLLQRKCPIPNLELPNGLALIDQDTLKFVISCYGCKLHFVCFSDTLQLIKHKEVATTFTPISVSVSPFTQSILVADSTNQRVVVYSKNGVLLSHVVPNCGVIRDLMSLLLPSLTVKVNSLQHAVETRDGQYVLYNAGDEHAKLVWLDKSGRVIHTYDTNADYVKCFVQGREGQLLLANYWEQNLLEIDSDRRSVRFLSDDDVQPGYLCLEDADRRIYVADSGSLIVYRYLQHQKPTADTVTELTFGVKL